MATRSAKLGVVVFILISGPAVAGPILLGTLSNTRHRTDDHVVAELSIGDRLLYTVIGFADGGDLFEDARVTIRINGPPVTISESVTFGDDPDFATVARLLTDGRSLRGEEGSGYQEISVLGLLGGEELIAVHVPRFSAYDLFGYRVERIDRHVTFSMTEMDFPDLPDQKGTEIIFGGVYEIWGHPIPEPTTALLILFGMGIAAAVQLTAWSGELIFVGRL